MDREIGKIDSLLKYTQYDEAQKKADSLLALPISKDSKYLECKLRLLLLKGRMYELKEENGKALDVLLKTVDEAEVSKLYKIACHSNIVVALVYEKQLNKELAKQYLDAAEKICKEHHIEELYSTILIRRSLYQRFFSKDLDSAAYYTKQALSYAKKYNNEYDIAEASVMTAIYYAEIGVEKNDKKPVLDAIPYFSTAIRYYEKTNDYNEMAIMYGNISGHYRFAKLFDEAKIYTDSAYALMDKIPENYKLIVLEWRYKVFESLNQMDSAYFYLKKVLECKDKLVVEEEAATIKKITEQYDNDKKEATIKGKNQQMVLIGSLLAVIVIASVLLLLQNRRINSRNKIINKQLAELTKILEQKQVLLSELQHRVKNNLQHVISILEIQKESVDFNSIDELIRGNQNRIHSMALLHKKLNIADNVNDIDLKRYVTELSELVKDSYGNSKKKIKLLLQCDVETISIEKALPIGLIVVELVSNSMKHAFKKRSIGIISIEITKDEISGQNRLYYADNGDGFDFNKTTEKGLGQEIIKGLIDQLNGTFEAQSKNGFELMVQFE